METNATRKCELLVGLPEVGVLGRLARDAELIAVHIETTGERLSCARRTGRSAWHELPEPGRWLADAREGGRSAGPFGAPLWAPFSRHSWADPL